MAGKKNTKKSDDTTQIWKCDRCNKGFTTKEPYEDHFGPYHLCKTWKAQEDAKIAAEREAEAAAAARARAAAARARAARRHR